MVESKKLKICFTLPSILILLLFGSFGISSAQNDTLLKKEKTHFLFKKEIFPASLLVIGSALNYSNFRYFIREKAGNTTNIRLDNYIQYAPIAEIYIADLAGFRHKNTVWNQTKYLAISELVTSGIVQSLKLLTKVKRPNGGSLSFPSGHASNAFSSATVLFQEFKDDNMMLALSGYGFSTATGILRITNNRHWVSDVLAGAGIGILVTDLIYYWEPLKNWNPFNGSKKYSIEPGLSLTDSGILLGMRLHL